MEGVLGHITNLEKAVNSIQANISSFNEKVKKMEETVNQIEAGLTSTNADIEAVERKEKRTAEKIRNLEDQILYQDVYSRIENLRFFGIPETAQQSFNGSTGLGKRKQGSQGQLSPASSGSQNGNLSSKGSEIWKRIRMSKCLPTFLKTYEKGERSCGQK